MIFGRGWRYGVEAETAPRDLQALTRRLELKRRDGNVDGVVLLVRSTRRTRGFLAEAGALLGTNFPIDGSAALALLTTGNDPGGNTIIQLGSNRRTADPFASDRR
jgi:hypothetical protein